LATPIRAVIFDLFHTLTGLESEWSDLPVTSDFLGIDRRAWDRLLRESSRQRLTGEQSDPFLIVRGLADQIDPTIADEKIREAVEIRMRRFRHSLQRIPQTNVDALKRLRKAGLRLGLISNADKMEVAAWSDSPLAGLFDVEVFSCDVGLVKPEPAIYRKYLDGLHLSAEECMYVGDGGSNEMIGAREVGLKTVLVTGVIAELWPERIPARIEITDHHIEWMPEILPLLGLTR
jgi:putative hydrolase of the HAD superfamily